MVAIASHPMVSIQHQDRVIVHVLNDRGNFLLRLRDLSLEFGMSNVKGVPSVVDSQEVAHKQIEWLLERVKDV